MTDVVSALCIVLGSLGALRLLLSWGGLARNAVSTRRVHVRETCSLGGRQRLHVVEVEGERLLLGATESQVTLLRRLGKATGEASEAEEPAPLARRWRQWRRAVGLGALAALLFAAGDAAAQEAAPTLSLALEGATEPEQISSTLQIVALLTLVSVAPSILLMATAFTRIVIVLSLLRQAVGVHQLPPNQVLVGLALFLTVFVMAPVGERIHAEAVAPYVAREVDARTALAAAVVPVREYLLAHTREKDLDLFVTLSGAERPASPDDVSLATLLPSYMISELRTSFEIGFMVYLPFLIIDLVIASMLISMGMIVLPPIVISLPFKLMLFVLLDGWNLVISSLVTGLRVGG